MLISQSIIVRSLFFVAPHAASWDVSPCSLKIHFCYNELNNPLFLTTLSPCLSVLPLLPHQSSSSSLFCSFLSHLCTCCCFFVIPPPHPQVILSVIFLSQLLERKCYIGEFPLSHHFLSSPSLYQSFSCSIPQYLLPNDSYLPLSSLPFLLLILSHPTSLFSLTVWPQTLCFSLTHHINSYHQDQAGPRMFTLCFYRTVV